MTFGLRFSCTFSEILKTISKCFFEIENFYKDCNYSDQFQSMKCISGKYFLVIQESVLYAKEAPDFGGVIEKTELCLSFK